MRIEKCFQIRISVLQYFKRQQVEPIQQPTKPVIKLIN